MIPENFIEQWTAPWQTSAMIEQDLVISRALVELYNQPEVSNSLVFRGGTALNKIYINPSARYSEDLDFVQNKVEPIGNTINAIRNALMSWLGEPIRKFTERSVKLIYRYQSIDGTPAKLKIEINTTEHFHVQDLKEIEFSLDSEWFSGKSTVVTYHLEELMATKLRALYQRRKGRDLFDLWLVSSRNLIDVHQTISILDKYCIYNNHAINRALFEKNLAQKCQDKDFRIDIIPLLPPKINWDFDQAMKVVLEKIISKLS